MAKEIPDNPKLSFCLAYYGKAHLDTLSKAVSTFFGNFSCNFCGTIDLSVAWETPLPAFSPAGVGWTFTRCQFLYTPRCYGSAVTHFVWECVLKALLHFRLPFTWDFGGVWVTGVVYPLSTLVLYWVYPRSYVETFVTDFISGLIGRHFLFWKQLYRNAL